MIIKKRLLGILAILLTLGTLSATSCVSTPETNTVVSFINGVRAEKGVPALTYNSDLALTAIRYANYYASKCNTLIEADAPEIIYPDPIYPGHFNQIYRLGGSGSDLNVALQDLYSNSYAAYLLGSRDVVIYGAYVVVTTCWVTQVPRTFVSVIVGA